MILINLLPHRDAARKKRKDIFNVSLGASAVLGGLIAGAIFLWFQAQISTQQNKNQLLGSEIKVLEGQIKDIAGLEAEIAGLRARQQAVEDLQADRNQPRLFDDRSRQATAGWRVYPVHAPGQPRRDVYGGRTVQRARFRIAAQSGEQHPLVFKT